AVKLLVIPAMALPMLLLFNVEGVVAQAILITTAMPASVNSSVIAQQYSSDPEYAAAIVMMSTLPSAIRLPRVIYTALNMFEIFESDIEKGDCAPPRTDDGTRR